jgi:hypothetical protein
MHGWWFAASRKTHAVDTGILTPSHQPTATRTPFRERQLKMKAAYFIPTVNGDTSYRGQLHLASTTTEIIIPQAGNPAS